MLREEIAPRLRSLGFKGSGQSFSLPSESHWAIVGFQKSRFSDARSVSFTVNVTVVGRNEWETAHAKCRGLSARPAPNTGLPPISAPSGYWHERIGFLIPGNRDRWWNVAAQADTSEIAEAVVADIRDVAIPAMLERMRSPDIAKPY